MPSRLHVAISVCLAILIAICLMSLPTFAVEVWSGLTFSFSKPDGADGMLEENQDAITPTTIFARGDTAGLFNWAEEAGWNGSGPKFTEWATNLVEGNQEENIVATNYANLEFASWLTAYGGGGEEGLHTRMQGRAAVVHLIAEDIYLDLTFSYWAAGHFGGDGGFAYMRAEPPAPPATNGDYNGNLVVDAADYTVWRDTFGLEVDLGTGADGVADGVIDNLDYAFWKSRFGDVILMGGGSTAAAVPEPASWLLLLGGSLIITAARNSSPRGPGQHF